ncbi:MAG: hypothetical protein EOM20_05850 [Spartobacteria bacterium]|nr:hypothetical protein [Spartobacteria bacterium]
MGYTTGSAGVRFRILTGVAVVVLAFSSCRRAPEQVIQAHDYALEGNEFSVMTYNLHRYGLEDRDGDGQKNDPKPEDERKAVIAVIAAAQPDVLAVQEIGSDVVVAEFQRDLAEAGVKLPHMEYLHRGYQENNMAVFSRFPIISRQSHTDDTYSIGNAKLHVGRGFIDVDIQINAEYTFRLITAHLKSKVYHQLGQTEMRRNEARLLNKHVRKALAARPALNLLVVGDMNDTYQSAAMSEIVGKRRRILFDLRPMDYVGTVWTLFGRIDDAYERVDYVLASRSMMPEVVHAKTRAVIHPDMLTASDHRPLVAVFSARDKAMALDLSDDDLGDDDLGDEEE